jgi:hypothetical protein
MYMRHFQRNLLAAAALVLIAGSAGRLVAQEKSEKKEPETQLTGQLIDSRCYIKMGITDGDHHDCAIQCLKDGIPAAVLTDRKDLYVLLCPPMGLAEYANKTVRLTGKVDEKQHVIVPTKIEIKKGETWTEGKIPKSMM